MELYRSIHHQNLIALALAIFGGLLLVLVAIQPVAAQTCVWENWNCTPTPGPTPTGTITATATATLEGINFAPPEFNVPTSIPALQFTPLPAPSVVSLNITPLSTPDYPDATFEATPQATLATINTTINLSYTTPLTANLSVSGTTGITGYDEISGALGTVHGWLDDVISQTNYLTGEIESIQGSGAITVINAPDWYAPDMPRPMADVGWTFEQLSDPAGNTQRFTLNSWAAFFGYLTSLPFQMVKMLWQIVAYLGPLGLFLGWLLIMFVIVLAIHAQVFIMKFILVIVRLVVRLIELLG